MGIAPRQLRAFVGERRPLRLVVWRMVWRVQHPRRKPRRTLALRALWGDLDPDLSEEQKESGAAARTRIRVQHGARALRNFRWTRPDAKKHRTRK